MGAWITFLIVALALLSTAIKAVTSQDLVRTVLWLAGTLITTATAYVVLHADFVAAVQVLLYTGGVITLMLFAVMLTRHVSTSRIASKNLPPWRGLGAGLAFALLGGFAIIGVIPLVGAPAATSADTAALGRLIFTRYALPLETLSVLLLAAMIAAIMLARREDAHAPRRPAPRAPTDKPGSLDWRQK